MIYQYIIQDTRTVSPDTVQDTLAVFQSGYPRSQHRRKGRIVYCVTGGGRVMASVGAHSEARPSPPQLSASRVSATQMVERTGNGSTNTWRVGRWGKRKPVVPQQCCHLLGPSGDNSCIIHISATPKLALIVWFLCRASHHLIWQVLIGRLPHS